jgi:hypothetical protein
LFVAFNCRLNIRQVLASRRYVPTC